MTQPGAHEPKPRPDDEGAALIAAVMFGTLSCLLALSLVGRLVVEAREVANSLMQVRSYWAAMGIDAYAMSRTAQSGWCSQSCSGSTASSTVAGYIAEVGDLANWRYPDVGGAYTFTLKPTVSIVQGLLTAATLQVSTGFQQRGTAPAVANMAVARPLELRLQLSSGQGWGSGQAGKGATMSISSLTRPRS